MFCRMVGAQALDPEGGMMEPTKSQPRSSSGKEAKQNRVISAITVTGKKKKKNQTIP